MATTLVREPERARPRFIDTWRLPALLFVIFSVGLTVLVQSSHLHLPPEHPTVLGEISEHEYFGGWMQFDTGWYVYIADHGYDHNQLTEFKAGRQSAVAFFPAYPLTVRAVNTVVDDTTATSFLTTVAFGLMFVLLFWRWCRGRLSPTARRVALLALMLYPYSWFLFGSGYGDSLFLAFTLAAFVLLEKDRPVLAGLAGFVATAARPTGAAVLIGLAAVALERRGVVTRADQPTLDTGSWWARERSRWHVDRSKLRGRDGGVLLAAGGLISYCTFLAIRFGDPLAFATVQGAPGWDQQAGPHTWFKVTFFGHLYNHHISFWVRLAAQATLSLAFLVGVVFVLRRFGWGYATYTLVMVSIPLIGTGDFQGMGRYLIACFPIFAVVGEWLADRHRLRLVVLGVSGAALLTLSSLFGRGYYLT